MLLYNQRQLKIKNRMRGNLDRGNARQYNVLYINDYIPFLEKYSQSEARIANITYSAVLYATDNTCMQWVVFHSTFLSLLACLQWLCWGPFEDLSKISSETFQLLQTIINISDHVSKFSDDF